MADKEYTDPERMEKIVSLCKRRGFIYQSAELYGGLNGCWDYGPLGVEVKRNLKEYWWRRNVQEREDIVGLDGSILTHQAVLTASGHVGGFSDPMCDCLLSKARLRADQIEPQSGVAYHYNGATEGEWSVDREFAVLLREGQDENKARKTARQYYAQFHPDKSLSPKSIELAGETTSEEEQLYRIDSPYQGRMSIAFSTRFSANADGIVYVLMSRNGDFFTPTDPDDPALLLEFGSVVSVFRADLGDLLIERDGNDNITNVSLPFEARFNSVETTNANNKLLLSNPLVSGACFGAVVPSLSQGWYDNIIKVDPVNENVVWAGGIDLFRSDDGGRNFGAASYWYFDDDEPQYVHADQHEIVFHPDYDGSSNTTMYVTNDGGIYRTDDPFKPVAGDPCPFPDNPDDDPVVSSVTYESLNNGYEVTQFYHGDTGSSVPGGRDLYIGGTQDNGTVRSYTRYCTEGWDRILGGDGGYVAVNPQNNGTIYAETQNFGNIYRLTTSNGRERVQSLRGTPDLSTRDTGLFITPFAMDPNNPRVLWTGGFRPWRTLNAEIAAQGFAEGEGAYASNYDGADVEEGGGSGLRMSNSEAGLRGLERAREAARRRAAARAVEDAGASSSSAPKDEAFV